MTPPLRRALRALWANLRAGVAAGMGAGLAVAPLEAALALAFGGAALSVRVVVAFFVLAAMLFLLFGALVGAGAGVTLTAALGGHALPDWYASRARATGAAEPASTMTPDGHPGARWAALAAAFAALPPFALAARALAQAFLASFHDKHLIALALAGALAGLAAAFAAAAAAVGLLLGRLARAVDPARRFAPESRSHRFAGRLVAGLWTAGTAAALGAAYAATTGTELEKRFGNVQVPVLAQAHAGLAVTGMLLGLAAAPLLFLVFRLLGLLLRRLDAWNPFGRLPGIGAVVFAGGGLALEIAARKVELLRELIPARLIVAGLLFIAVGAALLVAFARGRAVLPARQPARKRAWIGASLVFAVFSLLTLFRLGNDAMVRYLATAASPPLAKIARLANWLSDFDRDGYGEVLGENDCAPFNPRIHPGAVDIPDNGIDENCSGADFSLKDLAPPPPGAPAPVPKEFQKDWSFVLITLDATRYDHTTFGGYSRDTTPDLAQYVKQSVSFTNAFASAAGTVASVPAILTSHFFHEEIYLGPEHSSKAGLPLILPANLTFPEVMKRAGYATGAIVSHYYFNGWGLDQGFDTFDNEEGATNDPARITSPALTAKGEAWLAAHQDQKFFLWMHYVDPHGYYEPHPGFESWVDPRVTDHEKSERNLYDGEIYFTDHYIGELLHFLQGMDIGQRTIVIITADHGDAFDEHGGSNHGWNVYDELIHVPLIVHVPELPPRLIDGAVSNLDILPTVADIAGVTPTRPEERFAGRSLVPQIFYGREDHDREVFSETNFTLYGTAPVRAVITERDKLIWNLKPNTFELYDRRNDPHELHNLYTLKPRLAAKLQADLQSWLDRVFYAQSQRNQAARIRDVDVLETPPRPRFLTPVVFGGAIAVTGYDLDRSAYRPGEPVEVTVYFQPRARVGSDYDLYLGAEPVPAEPGGAGAKGAPPRRPPVSLVQDARPPFDGFYPTSGWKPGEWERQRFTVRLPSVGGADEKVQLVLWLHGAGAADLKPTAGPVDPLDPTGARAVLGTLPVAAGTAPLPLPMPAVRANERPRYPFGANLPIMVPAGIARPGK